MTEELLDYYLSRRKAFGSFAETAQCIEDESSFFIQGDPVAYDSKASLEISFVPCDNTTFDGTCESDESIDTWIRSSTISLVIDSE